jgi:hypothetical protein
VMDSTPILNFGQLNIATSYLVIPL